MVARHEFGDEMAAEEPGASSDQNFHRAPLFLAVFFFTVLFLTGKESL
jgi:hypothetical protein